MEAVITVTSAYAYAVIRGTNHTAYNCGYGSGVMATAYEREFHGADEVGQMPEIGTYTNIVDALNDTIGEMIKLADVVGDEEISVGWGIDVTMATI